MLLYIVNICITPKSTECWCIYNLIRHTSARTLNVITLCVLQGFSSTQCQSKRGLELINCCGVLGPNTLCTHLTLYCSHTSLPGMHAPPGGRGLSATQSRLHRRSGKGHFLDWIAVNLFLDDPNCLSCFIPNMLVVAL